MLLTLRLGRERRQSNCNALLSRQRATGLNGKNVALRMLQAQQDWFSKKQFLPGLLFYSQQLQYEWWRDRCSRCNSRHLHTKCQCCISQDCLHEPREEVRFLVLQMWTAKSNLGGEPLPQGHLVLWTMELKLRNWPSHLPSKTLTVRQHHGLLSSNCTSEEGHSEAKGTPGRKAERKHCAHHWHWLKVVGFLLKFSSLFFRAGDHRTCPASKYTAAVLQDQTILSNDVSIPHSEHVFKIV